MTPDTKPAPKSKTKRKQAPAPALFDLICVGTVMSNILHNISQDERVPQDWRLHAKKRFTEWDKCLNAYNDELYGYREPKST